MLNNHYTNDKILPDDVLTHKYFFFNRLPTSVPHLPNYWTLVRDKYFNKNIE